MGIPGTSTGFSPPPELVHVTVQGYSLSSGSQSRVIALKAVTDTDNLPGSKRQEISVIEN